jgi:hypothetical protein
MTYRELMEEVIHLGFDSAVEDPGALCSATNRAVAQLRRELCPATGRFILTVRKPVLYIKDEITLGDGEEKEITCPTGVGISFEYKGHGTLVQKKEDGVSVGDVQYLGAPEWRTAKIAFSSADVSKVVLTGTTTISVRNIAVFDALERASANALPEIIGNLARFDVSAFCNDFLGMEEAPCAEVGVEIRDYDIYGKSLTLPADAGRVEITYRRSPTKATQEMFSASRTDTPDVPEEYVDMLPLLVAVYVWADLEPEKAAYYRELYNEQLQYAKLQQKHRGKCRVIDRKGWR